MNTKRFILLLFVLLTVPCFSQKVKGTVLSFKYYGQTYQIYAGAKIGLGKGLNADGGFECASREKVLQQSETYRSGTSSYHSSKTTDVHTGEKEYLGKQYSYGTVTVLRVSYIKKLDEYRVTLSTPEGRYNFYLMYGLKSGEVVAINGVQLPETASATTSAGNNATSGSNAASVYQTGVPYTVKLKNGSMVNGVLLQANGTDFKIETSDKNIIVFTAAEIESIQKKEAVTAQPASISNNSGFEIIQSPYGPGADTTPLGCFANYTSVGFMLLNRVDKSFAGKYGFHVSNHSGYLFKGFFFLGAGLTYTGSFGDSIKYNIIDFGLNQRFFLLRKKKVSPFLSLYESIGTTLKSTSINGGVAYGCGGDLGVNFLVGKKLSIAPYVGYSLHFMPRVAVEKNYYANQIYVTYRPRYAHYFVFGVTLGFRNL